MAGLDTAVWAWPPAPMMIRVAATAIEARGLRGFGDYAIVTAYGESRGDFAAVSSIGAAGMFQVLPKTAGLTSAELFDPLNAIASAADLVQRLRTWGRLPVVSYAAIRRGWRRPALVRDVLWLKTQPTLGRLRVAMKATGVGWASLLRPVPDLDLLGFHGWREVVEQACGGGKC
jgi:hypothetical protein